MIKARKTLKRVGLFHNKWVLSCFFDLIIVLQTLEMKTDELRKLRNLPFFLIYKESYSVFTKKFLQTYKIPEK